MENEELKVIARSALAKSYATGYCIVCKGNRVEMNMPLGHNPGCELGKFEQEEDMAELWSSGDTEDPDVTEDVALQDRQSYERAVDTRKQRKED